MECVVVTADIFLDVSFGDTLQLLWRHRENCHAGRLGMPTVVIEGQFRFVVNTRENAFEPPHVHVWVGNEDVCRIELNSGSYMENPPPGNFRDIMRTYARYAAVIRAAWDATHGR